MSDKLSDELFARHEANSTPAVSKPTIDTQSLPSLPKAGALPSLPRSKLPNWAEAASNKTAGPTRVTEVITFNDLDKKAQLSAITAVQKLSQATVETSRSSNGTTTFLIRGTAANVDAAKRELRRKLSPRTTVKFEISAEARHIVLGNKGSTIRQIYQDTDTKISVGAPEESANGSWSMRVVSVEIQGTQQSVKEAVGKINDLVEKAPASKSVRQDAPLKLMPFIKEFVSTLDVKSNVGDKTIELFGNSTSIIDATNKVDQYIADCENTFASRPVQVPAASADFFAPDVLFKDYGVVYVDGGLYGPAPKLEAATRALDELVSKTVITSLDISRAHNKSEAHANIVSAFLRDSNTLDRISKETGVNIKQEGNVHHIAGKDASSTSTAKKLLVEEVGKITPGNTLVLSGFKTPLGIASAKAALKSAKDKFVLPLVSSQHTVLVFRGDDEDFAPSQDEVTATLQSVASTLEPAQAVEASVCEKKVNVPTAEQRFIRDPLGSAKATWNSLINDAQGAPLVHVQYGKGITLSGLKEHVEKAAAAVANVIDVGKDYQLRSNYTETLKFDPKHVKNLIGRSGSNISKLRDEYQVKIDVAENGVITLKGLEARVRKARAEIEKTETRLQDEVVEKITIPQKYHAVLIGNKGKFVRRIKEKYDVHVQFPRPEASEEEDIIALTGPSKGVQQTKKEFNDLVEYEESHSQVQELQVPANTLNRIIGRGGANISSIKQDTETQIDVNREHNEDGTVTIKIVGEKKGISNAAKRVNAAVAEVLDAVERTIQVDSKFHRFIVGSNNETRRSIIAKAGGEVDPWNPRTLQVPPSSSSSTAVRISGPSKIVDSIEKQIKELIESLEAKERFSESFTMPSDQFTVLLGLGGSRKRGIEEKNAASIDIRRGNPCQITVKGPTEESVQAAKSDILSVVNLGQSKVKVPRAVASELLNRGMLAKQLEEEFNVRLTVGKNSFAKDVAPPKTPELGEKLYAIQIDACTTATGDSSDSLEWSLTGKSDQSCADAAKFVESNIKKISTFDTIGYIWFSQSSSYSQVIGRMGSTINSLRKTSGCNIFVPKNASQSLLPIEVRGTKDKVETTMTLITEKAGIRM